jgi:hypothetical protein
MDQVNIIDTIYQLQDSYLIKILSNITTSLDMYD